MKKITHNKRHLAQCLTRCKCLKTAKGKDLLKEIPIVGVPWWHSGLKIRQCHCSSSGRCGGMSSILPREFPHATGPGEKKKNPYFIDEEMRSQKVSDWAGWC